MIKTTKKVSSFGRQLLQSITSTTRTMNALLVRVEVGGALILLALSGSTLLAALRPVGTKVGGYRRRDEQCERW
jgi:hypothetical protein